VLRSADDDTQRGTQIQLYNFTLSGAFYHSDNKAQNSTGSFNSGISVLFSLSAKKEQAMFDPSHL
jgi:hypothetical protein